MEKKLKFSEFAELIGTTAKTVYKMEEREEIITVTEKVNNRQTRLVITNDEQIEHFKNVYRKTPVNVGNYEDMLTDVNNTVNGNECSQSSNVANMFDDVCQKMLNLNEEYTMRLTKVSEELANTKAQLLYLENKASKEPEYLHQINELNNEKLKLEKSSERLLTENEQLVRESEQLKSESNKLRTYNNILTFLTVTVIIVFSLVLVSSITYNVVVNNPHYSVEEQKKPVAEVVQPKLEQPPQPVVNNKKKTSRK